MRAHTVLARALRICLAIEAAIVLCTRGNKQELFPPLFHPRNAPNTSATLQTATTKALHGCGKRPQPPKKRAWQNLRCNLARYTVFLPKYCIRISISAVQEQIPSIKPAGNINIITAMVTTQFIPESATPHRRFLRSPIAPKMRTIP